MCIADMPQCSSFTLDVGSEVNEVSASTAWLFCNFLLNKKKVLLNIFVREVQLTNHAPALAQNLQEHRPIS